MQWKPKRWYKISKRYDFNFNNFNNFISNAPANSRFAWAQSPDTWKGNIGQSNKTVNVTLPNNQGTRTVDIPVMIYPSVTAKAPVRDKIGQNLERGTDVYNYIEFEDGKRYNGTATWKDNRQPDKT